MSRKSRQARKAKAQIGPIASPLVPLGDTLERAAGREVVGVQTGMNGESAENFRAFFRREPADLTARAVGNWEDLQALYFNVRAADLKHVTDDIQAAGGNPIESARANAAGVNLIIAMNLMQSAITLHLHPVRWNDRCACSLVRTAFECTGRAALIANGKSDEVHRWEQNAEFSGRDWKPALDAELQAAEPTASRANVVYAWLCDFTHMNYKGVKHYYLAQEGGNEDAYSALAYVGWAMAVVATRIVGRPVGAKYPAAMPAKLPWV